MDEGKLGAPINEMISALKDAEPSEKLLHALTLDHFYSLAGMHLPTVDAKIESTPITEKLEYAPDQFYIVLNQILDFDKQRIRSTLLEVWIKKLIDAGTIVHPMHLVKYLNALLTVRKALQELAAPTLGNKGSWLIQQNSKYEKLTAEAQDDVWNFGTAQQRSTFLADLLLSDPEKAVQTVKESWSTETKNEKRKHLNLFLQYQNDVQLPFVQNLYEKEFSFLEKESVTNREIRKILAKILLSNSTTSLHKKTKKILSNYIVQEKGGFLAKVFQGDRDFLDIPISEDYFFNGQNMLETYGIDPNSPKASDYKTDQLYWFNELCSALPFEIWTSLSGMKPKSVVRSFLNSDQFKITVKGQKISMLKDALLELTNHHSNDELVILLLNEEKNLEIATTLLTRLSASAWEAYLAQNLELVTNDILNNCPHGDEEMWSLAFSKRILSHTVERLHNASHAYDYTIGLIISEKVHVAVTNHLQMLNNGKVQENAQYRYWKNHIFDPIYRTTTIKNKIHQL